MSEIEFTVSLIGDIKVENSMYYSTETVDIFLTNKQPKYSSATFVAFLKESMGYSNVEITNFSWADYIYFNKVEVHCKTINLYYKGYEDKTELLNFIFSEFRRLYRASALTVIYRDNHGVCKFLSFRNDNYIYIELFKHVTNRIIEKFIIIKTTLKRKMRKERNLIILGVSPNYETPNVLGYLNQLKRLAIDSPFNFKIKEVDKDVDS